MISAELRKPTAAAGTLSSSEFVPQAGGLVGVDRDPAEIVHERHQDQEPEPERRHRQPGQAHHAEHIVELGVLLAPR